MTTPTVGASRAFHRWHARLLSMAANQRRLATTAQRDLFAREDA